MSEFLELLRNPAHWGFEAVSDVVFGGVAFAVGRIPFRRWVARHDRDHHSAGGNTESPRRLNRA